MSYASTMQFLRTGMAPGGGTEDPRYAGFAQSIAGACGGPRPCGAPPIAGTTRFGYKPAWRLTPGAYHDYSSTFRVPGAPPSPGESQVAHTAAIAGAAPWKCAENCAQKYPGDYQFPEYQACLDGCLDRWPPRFSGLPSPATPTKPAKPAVTRPLWEASQMARFAAGKSRADSIRLGAKAASVQGKPARAAKRPTGNVRAKVHHAMQTGQNHIKHNGQVIPVGCGFVEWDEGVVAKCCTPGSGDYDFDSGNEVCVMFPL